MLLVWRISWQQAALQPGGARGGQVRKLKSQLQMVAFCQLRGISSRSLGPVIPLGQKDQGRQRSWRWISGRAAREKSSKPVSPMPPQKWDCQKAGSRGLSHPPQSYQGQHAASQHEQQGAAHGVELAGHHRAGEPAPSRGKTRATARAGCSSQSQSTLVIVLEAVGVRCLNPNQPSWLPTVSWTAKHCGRANHSR